MNTGSHGFFRQTSKKNPLGLIAKEEGAIKYVVPNQNYILSTNNKTNSRGSPRSTMYTQMGHVGRESGLKLNSPVKNEEPVKSSEKISP